MAPVPDFTGWATRHGLKCADGRTILAGAFKHNDGKKVPLVWQHGHKDSDNILGHAILHYVDDGVRAEGYFNETPRAQNAKIAVQHGDITALSIYANQLREHNKNVQHGNIGEVSLVLSGANPGAYIDNVNLEHGGEITQLADEVIIYTDDVLELTHHASGPNAQSSAQKDEEAPMAGSTKTKPTAANPDPDGDGDNDLFDPADGGLDPNTATLQDVFDTFTDEQKNAVYALIGAAVQAATTPDATQHSDEEDENSTLVHALTNDPVVKEVFDTLDELQQKTVYAVIGAAVERVAHSAESSETEESEDETEDSDPTITHNEEGATVPRNVFEQNSTKTVAVPEGAYIVTAEDVQSILHSAVRNGGSLKAAVTDFAMAHGIDDINVMFPEVKLLQNEPDFIKRRTEWVQGVLASTRKSPFSRVKTILADITPAEARAKGYITGNMKNEEFFGVVKRTTTPTTVYKKQKLDRDDILDITEFNIIAWLQAEMRLMLDEEVARAILIGDGRDISDQDKIKDPMGAADGAGIRSVLNDHEIYTTTVNIEMDALTYGASGNADTVVDAVVQAMRFYRGTGRPTFYTTLPTLTSLLLAKDSLGRRLYPTQADLAAALMVSDIQTVEPMEELTDTLGIIVNLTDYNVGADSGGEVNMFDFFDIDFNQQKYLIETRLSGALVKFKSAIVIKMVPTSASPASPTDPTFVKSTGVVTIPTVTGVAYKNADTGATLSAGAQTALAVGATLNVNAVATSGYYLPDNYQDAYWSFTR